MGLVDREGAMYFATGYDNTGLYKGKQEALGIIKSMMREVTSFDVFAGLGTSAAIAFAQAAKGSYDFSVAYEKNMREVMTISAAVKGDFAGYSQAVINMTTEIPVSADTASKALYQIVSAGYDGAEGMKLLEVSAKAAIGGVTDTTTAADAITTLLNAYKMSATDAESISDQLFMTAKLGKTTFGELGQSIAQAAPIAASFGIETEQVLAAVATLTKQGTPTAQAMTQIRAAIIGATKVLGDGAFEGRTFQDALQEIATRANGSESALRVLVPEIEGMNGILGLTGRNAAMASSDLKQLENSLGATGVAYQDMAQNTEAQLQLLKNNITATLNPMGESVKKKVQEIAEHLNSAFASGDMENAAKGLEKLIMVVGAALLTYKANAIGATIATTAQGVAKTILTNIEGAYNTVLADGLIAREKERASLEAYNSVLNVSVTAEQEAILQKRGLKTGTTEYSEALSELAKNELQSSEKSVESLTKKIAKQQEGLKVAKDNVNSSKEVLDRAKEELDLALKNNDLSGVAIATKKVEIATEHNATAAKQLNNTQKHIGNNTSALSTQLSRKEALQNQINAAAQAGETASTNVLTTAKSRLTLATKTLTTAIKANPLGALLTVVGAVTTAMMYFNKETSKLQKTIEEASNSIGSEKLQIDLLFAKLKQAKDGTKEYDTAKQNIMSKYGLYLKGLGNEKTALDNIAVAYRVITEEAEKSARARAVDRVVGEASDELVARQNKTKKDIQKKLESRFKGRKDEYGLDLSQVYYAKIALVIDGKEQMTEELEGIIKKCEETVTNVNNKTGMVYTSTVNDVSVLINRGIKAKKEYDKTISDAMGQIGGSDLDSKRLDVQLEVLKNLRKQRSDIQNLIEGSNPFDLHLSSLKRDLKTIDIAISGTKNKISTLKSKKNNDNIIIDGNSTNPTPLIANNTESTQSKTQKSRIEAENKLKDSLINVYYSTEQAIIDKKEEGYEKELEQINLNYKKKIASIELWEKEQRQIVIDAQKTAYIDKHVTDKGFEVNEKDTAFKLVSNSKEAQTGSVNTEKVNAEKKLITDIKQQWQGWADDYQHIEDKITEITKKATTDRENIQLLVNNGTITKDQGDTQTGIVNKGEQTEISKLETDKIKFTQNWVSLFSDLDTLSRKEIKILIENINNDLKNSKLAPADASALLGQLDKAKEKLVSDNPFANLYENAKVAFKNIDKTDAESVKKRKEAWKDLGVSMGQSLDIAAQAMQGVGSIADTLGASDETKQTISEISGALSGMGNVAKGIATGDISSIISGTVRIFTNLFSLFDGRTKRANRAIKVESENIRQLERQYKDMGRAVEKSLGTEFYSKQVDQTVNMQEQIEAKQRQIDAEKSKKKKKQNQEQIEAWEDEQKELDQQIRDTKQGIIDELSTTDLKSYSSDLSSSIVDGLVNGAEGIDGVIGIIDGKMDDLIKNMIAKQFDMLVVQKKMKPMFEAMEKGFGENSEDGFGLSKNELQAIKDAGVKGKEGIMNSIGDLEDVLNFMDVNNSEAKKQSATSKGFETMSQETASKLEGTLYSMRNNTAILNEIVAQTKNVSVKLLTEAERRNEMIVDLKGLFALSLDYLDAISKNTFQLHEMNKRLGNIETYTSRL